MIKNEILLVVPGTWYGFSTAPQVLSGTTSSSVRPPSLLGIYFEWSVYGTVYYKVILSVVLRPKNPKSRVAVRGVSISTV